MNKQEFLKIKKEFKKEEKRWKSLKIGQSVYESVAREWEFEYFEIIIDKINVDERFIVGKDLSQKNKVVNLRGFSTTKELKKEGIEFAKQ